MIEGLITAGFYRLDLDETSNSAFGKRRALYIAVFCSLSNPSPVGAIRRRNVKSLIESHFTVVPCLILKKASPTSRNMLSAFLQSIHHVHTDCSWNNIQVAETSNFRTQANPAQFLAAEHDPFTLLHFLHKVELPKPGTPETNLALEIACGCVELIWFVTGAPMSCTGV
jgi:hypothetical protein